MAITGTTDSTGKVTLSVAAGTYSVSAAPPAGFSVPAAQQAVVVAGVETDLKFQLTAAPGTIVVSVVDEANNPVSGVLITAQ